MTLKNLLRQARCSLLVLAISTNAWAVPPYSGTIFLDPDIITPADYSAFRSLSYTGQGMRWMFDRRVNTYVQLNAYLFIARYSDGLQIEIQVNPEFGSIQAASVQAEFYAPVFGRLPRALRKDVQTSWIHQGNEFFGGGNNNLLIHTGTIAQQYIQDGILEEVLVHEASHTSLDAAHANSAGWLAAQVADNEFISTYARDNATREDIAETFLVWLAVRHRANRVSADYINTANTAVPNRLSYFDAQQFNLFPLYTLFENSFE